NIENINPIYFPYHTLSDVFQYGWLDHFFQGHDFNFSLLRETNVPTYFKPFLLDYGLFGAIVAIFVLFAFCSYIYIKTMRSRNIWLLLSLVVILHTVILS